MIDLSKEVQYIKSVGPTKAKVLNKIGVYTLGDLITYFPRGHEDRSKPVKISEMQNGQEVLIEAKVITDVNEMRFGPKKAIQKMVVADDSGSCVITWFNQSYIKNMFSVGEVCSFYGKASINNGRLEMKSPVFDKIQSNRNTGKIVPIYPLTKQLKQGTIRAAIENGLKECKNMLEENLPKYLIDKYKLMGINEATNSIHFPKSFNEYNKARERLVFEELLSMQLALSSLKTQYTVKEEGIKFKEEVKMEDVISTLKFDLTNAQKNVLKEINNDMENSKSMNRLLQGDVGSGKTVVSVISAFKAVKSGYQVAIMAPTAILAEQHLEEFSKVLEAFGIKCDLLLRSNKS